MVAHCGHKADYPILEKSMLEDARFKCISQCASGMAKISYTYELVENREI